MASNRVFVDANVLLEIILARSNGIKARRAIAENSGSLFASTLTGHLVMHFCTDVVGLQALQAFLTDYQLLSLDQADFDWAFANVRNDDFEDALQLAVAVRNGCKQFITFDKGLFETYKDLPGITIKLLG